MKERPILFKAEMVNAILDGSKTQTRRVVKNVRNDNCIITKKPTKTLMGLKTHVTDAIDICPFGKIGDQLWVRENFRARKINDDIPPRDIPNKKEEIEYEATKQSQLHWGKQRPSIHMPRWASRIQLEITDIRVERLHDLSEEDARSEGVVQFMRGTTRYESECRHLFGQLWQDINGIESWENNPWVWIVEFKNLTP